MSVLLIDKITKKNSWSAKFIRTITSVLPVSKARSGKCAHCGQCCQLPNKCLFLRYKPDGKSYCSIWYIRPLNCRKYPRHKSEWITERLCGYKFD